MRLPARVLGVSLFAASLPLVAGFGICGPGGGDPPPPPRGCDTPAPAALITAVEVGSTDGEFVPSAMAGRTVGGQGIRMLGYRIGVRATEPITCIAVTSAGRNLTVESSGEWFVTDADWEIADTSIEVVVEAYGMRVERTMSLEGGADAGTADGGATDAGAEL
ncbi:MAG: hypothetical protein M3Y87_30150 [Myxococcota bacterium]|nr:hypothetical protein [Myxococcota bacterium]